MTPHLFIFGLGYSSQEIARVAMAQGYSVSGTTRSPEKHAALKALGITPYVFDKVPAQAIAGATHILSSVPPQENLGDIVLQNYAVQFHADAWLGYLSTTGVYGNWQGAWVDEASELRPNNARLERRVDAEKKWLGLGGHVFRLAGIYGPGRNVLEDVKDGSARRIDKPGQVFSRIHVEDIAATVLASMLNPSPSNAYNVCDDLPAPQADVLAYACELLGVLVPPLIPFEQAQLSPMGREFYMANRRVNNDKIKRELGARLRYPTYKEGLARLLLTIGKS
ncbi:MAG: SDR family oxidoreductase [Alphaproteobacteria bacterium]|nr:SDR family oxidoreductase [Alphaproteobacteria bacterium]